MSRLDDRLSALSPQKRKLIEMLLNREQAAASDAFVAPTSALERTLAEIWADVLGLKRVGVDDNFITIGGDSIRAIQISARARKAGLALSADRCFKQPTIRLLAASLQQGPQNALGALPPPVARSADTGPRVLSFGEERLWLEHQMRKDVPIYNTFMAVRIDGPVQVEVLTKAIEALVARHDVLRAHYVAGEGTPRRITRADVQPEIALLNGDAAAGDSELTRLRQLAAIETQKPFDLERAPLFRCALVAFGGQVRYMILTAHHIICDAWSMGILLTELTRVYEAFASGLPSPLMPLEIGYAEFAEWQRELVGSGRLAEQFDYWRTSLENAPVLPALPLQHERPAMRSYRGLTQFFELSEDLLAAVDRYAKAQGVTRYIAGLTAYFLVIHSFSGQGDLVVGTPVLGRPFEEAEKLIGFFLNTVVLRARLDADRPLAEFTQAVKAVAADALRNQDVPYDRVLRALDVERSGAHTPLFQLWFVMQTGKAATLRSADLRLTPMELDRATAAFDLSLSLQEAESGLSGWLEYSTDLVDAAFARRFVERYERVLGLLEKSAAAPVRELTDALAAADADSARQVRNALRQRITQYAREQGR